MWYIYPWNVLSNTLLHITLDWCEFPRFFRWRRAIDSNRDFPDDMQRMFQSITFCESCVAIVLSKPSIWSDRCVLWTKEFPVTKYFCGYWIRNLMITGFLSIKPNSLPLNSHWEDATKFTWSKWANWINLTKKSEFSRYLMFLRDLTICFGSYNLTFLLSTQYVCQAFWVFLKEPSLRSRSRLTQIKALPVVWGKDQNQDQVLGLDLS